MKTSNSPVGLSHCFFVGPEYGFGLWIPSVSSDLGYVLFVYSCLVNSSFPRHSCVYPRLASDLLYSCG